MTRFVGCILILFTIVSTSSSHVHGLGDACFLECSGKNTNYNYERGKRYAYDVIVRTEVAYNGTDKSENVVDYTLRSQAHFYVMAPCEFAMKLTSVEQHAISGAQLDLEILEKYVTQFSFDNGKIDSICPEPEDPVWSVNIKRGILSAFQNAQDENRMESEVDEMDINGVCPTEYIAEESRTNHRIVKKKKNLNSCRQRGYGSFGRTVPYNTRSTYQNIPLFNGHQTCTYAIREKILQSARCEEINAFAPAYSAVRGGLLVRSNVLFQFKDSISEEMRSEMQTQKSLNFDYTDPIQKDSQESVSLINTIMPRFCNSGTEQVHRDTPDLFDQLINSISQVTANDLENIWNSIETGAQCQLQKTYFSDALAACGSPVCIQFMVDHLTKRQQTGEQRKQWFEALFYVDKPQIDIINGLISFIPKATGDELLRISAVIHKHCNQDSLCAQRKEVTNALNAILQLVDADCEPKSKQSYDQTLYALRSFGNVQVASIGLNERLKCLRNLKSPLELRLAAIQSLRRISCDHNAMSALFQVFADHDENTEIRINAFLVLAKCPSDDLVDKMLEVLSFETSVQVGSLVSSYLESVKKGNSPAQEYLRHLLLFKNIQPKFKRDTWKFSHYSQVSTFTPHANLGLNTESAVVFSPEAYIPRQALLNLTMHIYGHSINFLEIGGRVAGLDSLVEYLFGPDGYFTNPEGHYFKEVPTDHANPQIRKFTAQYGNRAAVKENFDVSLYARVFGDEVYHVSYRDLDAKRYVQEAATIENVMLALAKEHQFEQKRSVKFADWTYTLPTVGGFPLKFNLNGIANINFAFAGKLDIAELLKRKMDVDIKLHIAGSVAARTVATMSILAGSDKFGISVKSRFSTNKAADIVAVLKDGKSLHMSLLLPCNEMDIFRFESETYIIRKRAVTSLYSVDGEPKTVYYCTSPEINQWLGFNVCYSQRLPAYLNTPHALLTGPTVIRLNLKNAMKNPLAYDALITWKMTPDEKRIHLKAENSDYEATFVYQPKRSVMAQVKSESKQLLINLHGLNEFQHKMVNYSFMMAKREIYKGHFLYKEVHKQPHEKYTECDMVAYGHENRLLHVHYDRTKSESPNHAEDGVTKSSRRRRSTATRTDVINGHVEMGQRKLSANYKMTLLHDSKLTAYSAEYKRNATDAIVSLQGQYRISKQTLHAFFVASSSITFSDYPNMNTDITLKASNVSGSIALEADLNAGSRTFAFLGNIRIPDDKSSAKSFEVKVDGNMINGEHKLTGTYDLRLPHFLHCTAHLSGPKIPDLQYELKYNKQIQKLATIQVDSFAKYGQNTWTLASKVTEVEPKLYSFDGDLKSAKENYISAKGTAKVILESKSKFSVDIDCNVSILDGVNFAIQKSLRRDVGIVEMRSLASDDNGEFYKYHLKTSLDNSGTGVLDASFKSQVGKPIDSAVHGAYKRLENGCQGTLKIADHGRELAKLEVVIPKSFKHAFSQMKGHIITDWHNFRNSFLTDYVITRGEHTTYMLNIVGKRDNTEHSLNIKFMNGNTSKLLVEAKNIRRLNFVIDSEFTVSEHSKEFLCNGFEAIATLRADVSGKLYIWKGNATYDCPIEDKRFVIDIRKIQPESNEEMRLSYRNRHLEDENEVQLHLLLNNGEVSLEIGDKFSRKVSYHDYSNAFELKWIGEGRTTHSLCQETTVATYPLLISSTTSLKRDEKLTYGSAFAINVEPHCYQMTSALRLAEKVIYDLDGKYIITDDDEQEFRGKLTSHIAVNNSFCIHLHIGKRAPRRFKMKVAFGGHVIEVHGSSQIGKEHQEEFHVSVQHFTDEQLLHYLNSTLSLHDQNVEKMEIAFKVKSVEYMAIGQYNAAGKSGQVEIRNPEDPTSIAKGDIVLTGPGQFRIQLDGDKLPGLVTVLLSNTADGQKSLSVELTNTKSPWKPFILNADSLFKAHESRLAVKLSNPEDHTSRKGFMISVKVPKLTSITVDLELIQHSGDTLLHACYLNELPSLFDVTFKINPKRKDRNHWSGFEVTQSTDDSENYVLRIALIDPLFSDHAYWLTKWSKVGDCQLLSPRSCRISIDSVLSYSSDVSRLVKVNIQSNRTYAHNGVNALEMSLIHPFTRTNLYCHFKSVTKRCENSGIICDRQVTWTMGRLKDDGHMRHYNFSYGYDRSYSYNFKLGCNEGDYAFHSYKEDNGYKMHLLQNGVYKYTISCDSDKQGHVAHCHVESPNAILLHGSARLMSKDWFVGKIWHSESNMERIVNLEVSSRIETGNMLTTRMFIHPNLTSNFQRLWTTLSLKEKIPKFDIFAYNLSNVNCKLVAIVRDMTQQMEPWIQQRNAELREFPFHDPMVAEQLEKINSHVKQYMTAAVDDLRNVGNRILAEVHKEILNLKELTKTACEMFNFTKNSAQGTIKSLEEVISQLQTDIHDHLKEIYERTKLEKFIQKLREAWQEFRAKTVGQLSASYSNITKTLEAWKEQYQPALLLKNVLLNSPIGISYNNSIMRMVERIEDITGRIFSRNNFDRLEKLYSTFLETVRSNDGKPLFLTVLPSFQQQPGKPSHYVIKVPFWTDMQNLEDVLRLFEGNNIDIYIEKIIDDLMEIEKVLQFLWNSGYRNMKKENRAVAALSFLKYTPSVAVLFDDSYYITFDGNGYEFSGPCSYLLAGDFTEKRFSIWVNYIKGSNQHVRRHSITLEYMKTTVEIQFDGNAEVNGKRVILPYVKENNYGGKDLAIFAKSEHELVVITADNVEIDCCTHHRVCTISLPHWYHGKSAGLFGVNDHEPSNDWTLPDGTITDKVDHFVSSWKISDDCQMNAAASTRSNAEISAEKRKLCAELLQSKHSSLWHCFHFVPPKPYYEICLSEAANSHSNYADNTKNGACNVVTAYLMVCKKYGIEMNTPSQCVHCQVQNRHLEEGEQLKTTIAHPPIDVIFLIEEGPCLSRNYKTLISFITKAAETIESSFEDEEGTLQLNVYGYNGIELHQPVHRHGHFLQTKRTSELMKTAISNLLTDEAQKNAHMDILEALGNLINVYPFRRHATKVVIMASSNGSSADRDLFYHVRSQVLEHGIHVHLLTEAAIELDGDFTSEIFGIDAESVFVGNGERNTDLRQFYKLPHDPSTVIALQTNGTILTLKPKTIDVTSSILGNSIKLLKDIPTCQICTCNSGRITSEAVCYPCEINTNLHLVERGLITNPFIKLKH